MQQRVLVITLVLGTVLLAAANAAAQTADSTNPQTSPEQIEAQQHFSVATTFLEQSRYDEAAREFAEAHRLSGRSELLLNVALAYEYALRYDEAITALERYLEESPETARHRTSATERVARLRRLRDSERTRVHREAEALARERTRSGSAARRGDARTEGAPPQREERGGLSTMQIGGIAALSAGVAAGVASLVTGLMASSKQSELEDACTDGVCPPGREDDIDDGESLATVSTVLTGVAIAAAAGGAVLLVLGHEPAERAPVSAGITLSPDGGGANVRVLF